MLRYFTSGESHGEALVAFLSGLPAGVEVDQAFLDRELWRRQQGYGRGGRMKIERARAEAMIKSQMPLEEKIKRADHVVWNNGERPVLAGQAASLVELWRQEKWTKA